MANTGLSEEWVVRLPRAGGTPRLRLFCFPHAGGGASAYRGWRQGLPADVEVCAVQLPGREGRIGEAPYTRLTLLTQALAQILRPYLDLPFAFFGHSLGALVGFELARRLRRRFGLSPVHLFVSGLQAPHLARLKPPVHDLPHDAFLNELSYFNGTPEIFFQEPDLLALYVPLLRADLAMVETYTYNEDVPLDCPISGLGGDADGLAAPERLAGWAQHTRQGFSLQVFPGDHFYLRACQPAVLAAISKDLKPYLDGAGRAAGEMIREVQQPAWRTRH